MTKLSLLRIVLVSVILVYLSDQSFAKQIDVTEEAIFDISIGGQPKGTVVIALFGHETPKTVANFAKLSSVQGFNGQSYRNSRFHRVIPNFMIQGGDIVRGDGRGSISIYGGRFPDENFNVKHTEAGLLSMANSGPDTNGSQFFITLVPTPWLDGKHTVFGKVVSGMEVVNQIVNVGRDANDRPLQEVLITRSVTRPVNARLTIPRSLVSPHANSFDSLDFLIASETSRNHYRKSGKQARLGKINYSDDKGYADSISSGPSSDKSSNDYYMPISAAVQTSKHMIDVKEVDINSEPFSPQTVIVDATVMPLTIYFRSTSSMVKVIQEHLEGKGDIQHTQSEEEPHRLFHEVHKPIIQEVHEVIKPYRRIIQEMQPVYEDVKTIISRPFEGSRQPEQMYEDISPYERNRFSVNDDRVSGYITNMNNFNEDLMRITQTINDNNVPQTNLTLAPKAQLSDYASEVPSDVGLGYHGTNTRNEKNSQDIRNTRDKVDSLSGVINSTTSSTTTTSTTPVPSVEVSSTAKRKRHRTPVVKTSTKRVHKTHVTNKDSSSDLTRSRRLAIKRLVNKIDREKRKIRLGFFGIYGINLIPYIYDQFAYDVKIRVPSSNKQTTQ